VYIKHHLSTSQPAAEPLLRATATRREASDQNSKPRGTFGVSLTRLQLRCSPQPNDDRSEDRATSSKLPVRRCGVSGLLRGDQARAKCQ
jgi:hypothetical protein